MKARVLMVLRSLHDDEAGQDMIEYALIAMLLAFGAVLAMGKLATGINTFFGSVVTIFGG